jgi:hypothetical protein
MEVGAPSDGVEHAGTPSGGKSRVNSGGCAIFPSIETGSFWVGEAGAEVHFSYKK